MEIIYAFNVWSEDEYVGLYEYYTEELADEAIEEFEKEGLDYEMGCFQYYIPSWYYKGQ